MTTLPDFLRARLDEYEAVARAESILRRGDPYYATEAVAFERAFDPTRVLADVEAKRRIVDLHEDPAYSAGAFSTEGEERSMNTLRILALPYADHPAYQQEWKP